MNKNTLTSRERVLRAFNRVEPDRVPINYMDNPGLHLRLKRHLGLADDDEAGLYRWLETDFDGIWLTYTGPKLHPDIPDRKVDVLWGVHRKWIENESGGYWDYCDYPLKDAPEETYDTWPMPSPDDFDYSVVAEICRRSPDKAIHCGDCGMGDILNSAGMLMGVEQAMMEIIDVALQTNLDKSARSKLDRSGSWEMEDEERERAMFWRAMKQ